ncbi:methyltransferase domain-containing protein [Opitutus sp. GAS368]|uniref:Eco57I restriction-modification methylase domain-containing protein n=1 Tax=Opitutus sp. GAS368 TaxID=1882749 RepID=UPI00156139AD|nr:methyltransferase domain-containing protein [Opitutus sp. GAS368]
MGEAYARIFSPEERRSTGTTFTPAKIISQMFDLAARLVRDPGLVVDCGAGSGRFTIAALRHYRKAHVLACEINPLLALIIRATARVAGLDSRMKVVLGDFRALKLPRRSTPTLFIGNPPYVRHHDIEPHWKRWYQDELARHHITGSQLAGLHLHFFLKARQLGQPGDAGCFITSAEWLDVNYGKDLRKLLLNGLGGHTVHLFPAAHQLFADALTTSAITTFQVGQTHHGMGFTESNGQPRRLTHWVPTQELQEARAWSSFARPLRQTATEATATLGDYFLIHRGQVTGANHLWIANEATPPLPASCLFPAVTHAKEIIRLGGGPLCDPTNLQRVIDLPADLGALPARDRRVVEAFIAWAETHGGTASYIAQHRRPWWRVKLKAPPSIIMTYMGRRPPVFARNLADARLLNIAHGLYPRTPIDDPTLDALVGWLNEHVLLSSGRAYAGGLIKFEPGEAMRIPIPPLEHFVHVA